MIRVGKSLAPNTYAIYVGAKLVDVVCGVTHRKAYDWAQKEYGSAAYTMETVQARDIAWEV